MFALKQALSAPLRLRQLVSQLTSQQQRNMTTFKLNTGATIPAIGFGTWQDKEAQESAVLLALKAGYKHIDGAAVYGTEPAIGKALTQSGVNRSDIFITTKLWNNAHHPDDVEPALDASLKNLGISYIDLYLMHWPSPFARSSELMPKASDGKSIAVGETDYVETWRAMEKLVKKGKARAIGVSNFNQAELERILSETDTVPAVHQMELHPYLQQKAFVAWHAEKGIHCTQYSPFGNANPIYSKGQEVGKLIHDDILTSIGEKYGKSGAQVALAWGVKHGRSVIPKSKTEGRIAENLEAVEGQWELSEEDVRRIDEEMDKKLRFNDPSERFGWNFYKGLDGK